MLPLLLLLALCQDTSAAVARERPARSAPTPAQLADAYADLAARVLLDSARARRARSEELITSYRVSVTQRIGVGIRALRRDRMVFGQELAADVAWRRDSASRVTVRGARQRVPVAVPGDHVPDDLDG